MKHISGTKNSIADTLSRRPLTNNDLEDRKYKQDINKFVEAEVSILRVQCCPAQARFLAGKRDQPTEESVLQDRYSPESEEIAQFLTSLQRPARISLSQFQYFKKRCLKFVVEDGHLFRRNKTYPECLRRVLDREDDQTNALETAYADLGHKGREATYRLIKIRYW